MFPIVTKPLKYRSVWEILALSTEDRYPDFNSKTKEQLFFDNYSHVCISVLAKQDASFQAWKLPFTGQGLHKHSKFNIFVRVCNAQEIKPQLLSRNALVQLLLPLRCLTWHCKKSKSQKIRKLAQSRKKFPIKFDVLQGQFCKVCRLVFDFPFLHYVQFFALTIYLNWKISQNLWPRTASCTLIINCNLFNGVSNIY